MFDKFEPFKVVQKYNFTFQPTRFEMWIGGKMVANGEINSTIFAKIVTVDGDEKMEISFDDSKLNNELSNKTIFDRFVTATDRLQLITVPNETNSENIGIMMFKMTIGATRQNKNFNRNEPYCCNLFYQQGKIVKITFSYSNPEKLLEFYSGNEIDYTSDENPLKKIVDELFK